MWRYWWQRGHYAEGRRWYEAALDVGRNEPEQLRAQASSGLGSMFLGSGDTTRAIERFEGCLDVFRRNGDYARTVGTLTDLGIAHTNTGALERAQASFEESVEMTRNAGDIRRTAVNLINLGDLAMLRRDMDQAAELFKAAFDAMVEVGDTQSAGNARANHALVELLRGNLDDAAELLGDAIRRLQQTDDRYSILHSMITVGALLAAKDESVTAATILGRAQALQKEMDIAINPTELRLLDETLPLLQTRLGEKPLEMALSAGRALDHETGLDMVLSSLGSASSSSSNSSSSSSGSDGGPGGARGSGYG
jgi:tetratricopeptide (TPR) repeat protein